MNARDMFPIHEVSRVRTFSEAELRACKSLGDAYDKTMSLSGLERKQIASQTGIHPETLSMMASGIRNCPANKLLRFYEVCQNLYALQWQSLQFGKVYGEPLTDEQKVALYDYEQAKQKRAEIEQLRRAG